MTVELWIGQPFDTQHEQVALARFMYDMEQRLGRKREIYFVLANCLVGGNQIDLVILKQNAIIVVELKECHEPFRATENGKWLTPSGRVVGTGSENPLEQVGRYRRRWINFLRHRGSRFLSPASLRDLTVEHVTSFVCISPKLHPSVNQDIPPLPWFRLTGLDQIVGLLEQHSSDFKFTEADLRRLIKDLNLRKLDSLESVVSPEAALPPVSTMFGAFPIPADLADRQSECALLKYHLNDKATAVINVRGPRGVGKTELAAWLAARAQEQDHRVRWINCRQKDVSLQSLLVSIAVEIPNAQQADYICNPNETTQDRIAAAVAYLDTKPTLLVLDDYDAIAQPKPIEALLTDIVRHARRIRVLLTAQARPECLNNPLWRPQAVAEIPVEGLPRSSAGDFLGQKTFTQLSPEQLDAIWQKASGIPYLVRVLTTIVLAAGDMPDAPLLLRDEHLSEWFGSFLDTLSGDARRLAYSLSVILGPLDLRIIRFLARPNEKRAAALRRELVDRHVLRQIPGSGTTITYDLVRDYLYARAPTDLKRSAHASAGTYFAGVADRAQQESERLDYLQQALHHFRLAPKPKDFLAKSDEVYRLLSARGDWTAAQSITEAALEFARQERKSEQIVSWLLQIGTLEIDREQFEVARKHLEEALRTLPKSGHRASTQAHQQHDPLRMQLLLQRGRLAYRTQDYTSAEGYFNEAIDLARDLGDQAAVADCLIRLGQIARRRSQYEAAREHLSTAHTIAENASQRELAFEAVTYLGVVARRQNDVAEASRLYQAAYQMAREIGDRLKEEICLSYLGRLAAHPRVGQLTTAAKFLLGALAIARDIHNTRGIRIELTRLIDVMIALQQYDRAERLLAESERLNREANDEIGLAWNLKHRGQLEQRADAERGNALIREGIRTLQSLGIADEEWRPEFEAALKR